MCGIAGIFAYHDDAKPVSDRELLRIRDRMVSRGPDGAGMWMAPDSRIALAHRRLAVIDLSSLGAQPMACRNGRYQIVFNGEIYNYRELRAELKNGGVQFLSESDTEVVLQLFCNEQERMLERLRGMFALGIWDVKTQSLFIARDTFGIKPLYFCDDGQTLRFASQVRALIAGGQVSREVDETAEADYWVWGHVCEPRTIYKHVRSLEPGTWLRVSRDGRVESGAFQPLDRLLLGVHDAKSGSPDCAVVPNPLLDGRCAASTHRVFGGPFGMGTLRDVMLDTVRHHLIADVPVGVFLSAGIDSTTLTALAMECGGSLRTLTLGFEEYRGTPQDETALAESVARMYGTRHETVWIRRSDFEEIFSRFVGDMDQPTIDGLNTWLISRAAAELGLKAIISGLGGDELFGGYPSFRQVPFIRRVMGPVSRVPQMGRAIRRALAPIVARISNEKYAGIAEYGGTLEGAYLLRRAVRMPWELPDEEKFELPELPVLAGDFASISYLESSLYMRNQLLRDSDWASMSHSLELRVPLVDVPLACHVAAGWRQGQQATKFDLAATASPPLPESVLRRQKTGFSVPVREWLLAALPSQQSSNRGLRGWQSTVLREFLKRDGEANAHV